MYALLWRSLPGPWYVRVLLLVVILGVAVMACYLWLFPAVDPYMPFNQQTVESGA